MESKPKSSILLPIMKIFMLLLIGFGLFWGWAVGCLLLAFSTRHAAFYMICLAVFAIAIFSCVIGIFFHIKCLRKIAYACMVLPIIGACAFAGWNWWTVDRYPVIEQQVKWWQYRPGGENSKLVKFTVPDEFLLSPQEDYPRMNGAYALYPIYAAIAQEMYPANLANDYNFLSTNGSDVIYDQLLQGNRELIFALAPSKKQEEDATEAGLTYELTPFCKDAFVFYVNAKNPIDNLTTEQIKGIYSGEITNWKEVGSPVDVKIIPFQRNEGSGSQTTLQKLMGETPIMPPIKEDRVGGMGDIINDTANYRNYNAAIGFSFRYYSSELLQNNQIKLLSIDGVAPTVENISNGTYPLVATAYLVTARPRSANTQRIVDFMCSPTGQELVEKTGYIPFYETK